MSDHELQEAERASKTEPARDDLRDRLMIVRERHGFVYTSEFYSLMWRAVRQERRVEISREVFDECLEVLPPYRMGQTITTVSGKSVRADFWFLEGCDRVTAFWREGGRYFAEITNTWGST